MTKKLRWERLVEERPEVYDVVEAAAFGLCYKEKLRHDEQSFLFKMVNQRTRITNSERIWLVEITARLEAYACAAFDIRRGATEALPVSFFGAPPPPAPAWRRALGPVPTRGRKAPPPRSFAMPPAPPPPGYAPGSYDFN